MCHMATFEEKLINFLTVAFVLQGMKSHTIAESLSLIVINQ